MKGIVVAGGRGTRLWPITQVASKQLLPVFDKPLIYYPLATLMLAGIRDIAIVVTPEDKERFVNLLGNGTQWGLQISYHQQLEPKGIAHAIIQAPSNFFESQTAVILGDNLLYGMGLGKSLNEIEVNTGAQIFAHHVSNPKEFGVVQLDEEGFPKLIEEKPADPKSNLAIPGLYFFDNSLREKISGVSASERGELEITDVLKMYLAEGTLTVRILERGVAWLDTGSPESLLEAGEFVRIVEKRQGLKIACPEEIAFKSNWITELELLKLIENYPNGNYKSYLERVLIE